MLLLTVVVQLCIPLYKSLICISTWPVFDKPKGKQLHFFFLSTSQEQEVVPNVYVHYPQNVFFSHFFSNSDGRG